MSQLPIQLLRKLEKELNIIKEVLQIHYTKPFFFEHGDVCSTKRAGSCINHAHIHAVPLQFSIYEHLKYSFSPKRINTLIDLKKQYKDKIPYFFLEQQNGKRYICNIKQQVHSQFIRRIIAQNIEMPDHWDWGIFPEFENMRETINTLRKSFQKSKRETSIVVKSNLLEYSSMLLIKLIIWT